MLDLGVPSSGVSERSLWCPHFLIRFSTARGRCCSGVGGGIGKSPVWFTAVRLAEARGYRVLRARPAESEARLSYAALADLIGPAFDEARAQLPDPQELALAA